MGEAALGLGRSRREDAQSLRVRVLEARQPEGRLADTGIALEHERGGPSVRLGHEGMERGELLLPADDLGNRHLATMVTEAMSVTPARNEAG